MEAVGSVYECMMEVLNTRGENERALAPNSAH